jgi:hypothetical protein
MLNSVAERHPSPQWAGHPSAFEVGIPAWKEAYEIGVSVPKGGQVCLSGKAKVGLRIARDQEAKPKLDEHKSGHPHHSGYRARYRAS